LQTVSGNTVHLDVGVPSRGWHGEAYRGHIFWDELFIFPLLNLSVPELTRSLLMYRYRRLPEARHAAAEAGYRGAMFPWQSGSNGREESQRVHLNPRSGRWIPDHTYRQRHVNSAIAYNIWQYYQSTADREFLAYYGAEMLIEIAKFWSSRAIYDARRDRFELHRVVGPDEFHTAYPGRDEPGLRNNAYTNVMAAWVLQKAGEVLGMLPEDRRRELLERLEVDDEEIGRWDRVSRRMCVPFHGDGIISQFEGYESLREFDWDTYRERYGDIQRLDRILEAEEDTTNRYQVSKQADVLMLFYLFSSEELVGLMRRLGYSFVPQQIPDNISYYLSRTSHGSTLSRIVHSWVLSRLDRDRSWHLFGRALESDFSDIQGGTTPEGIHLGAMAGTVDLVRRCYLGVETRDDVLWLNPCLPAELDRVDLRLRYRGHWLGLHVSHTEFEVCSEEGWGAEVAVGFRGTVRRVSPGDRHHFRFADSGGSSYDSAAHSERNPDDAEPAR
jgi:alpha,alpha-trehalase